MRNQAITGLVFGDDVRPEFRIMRWGGILCCVILLILTILSRMLPVALFFGVIILLLIAGMSSNPCRVTYSLSEDGVMLCDERTKFHRKNNKFVSWDEIRNGREVVATLPHGYQKCAVGNYIVLQKKLGMIDHDCYGTRANLNLLIKQPNAIPIPKTDETVQLIEQYTTIQYLSPGALDIIPWISRKE